MTSWRELTQLWNFDCGVCGSVSMVCVPHSCVVVALVVGDLFDVCHFGLCGSDGSGKGKRKKMLSNVF